VSACKLGSYDIVDVWIFLTTKLVTLLTTTYRGWSAPSLSIRRRVYQEACERVEDLFTLDFCMALGCSITSIYVLVWFYQINMKRLIGCHDHIIDIISGCDYIFEKKSWNVESTRNDVCLKFKVMRSMSFTWISTIVYILEIWTRYPLLPKIKFG
jgi:hypothetical protein